MYPYKIIYFKLILVVKHVIQDAIPNRLCRNEIMEIYQILSRIFKWKQTRTWVALWSDKVALMDLINLLYKKWKLRHHSCLNWAINIVLTAAFMARKS